MREIRHPLSGNVYGPAVTDELLKRVLERKHPKQRLEPIIYVAS